MIVDMGSVVLYLAGIFLLYLICRLFLKPIKWLLRLLLSCLAGGAGILLSNWILGMIGWHLAVNPLTCMIAGVLGIPGMILTYVMTMIL